MKAAIYTRVSTEDQVREGTSLQVQREFLEKFAKAEGWEIYHPQSGKIYQDDGYSGFSAQRPALEKLIKDAKHKKFDIVLCYKVDRFARNNQLLLNLAEQLNNLGIGFKSATESFDTVSASGKMALSMLGTVAQFERDRIIERVFPGMVKGVERGNWQGARYAPYGYKYNKEKKLLEVIPEEAQIVSLIFTMYLSGQSTNQIGGYLYEKSYKTRSGGKFHSKLVCDILKNKIYIGKLVWNRYCYDKQQKTLFGHKYVKNDPSKVVEADGRHKPIISLEEFNQVQDKLQRNYRGSLHRNTPHEYPLSGVLFCAGCAHKYRGGLNVSNHRDGIKKRWYRCNAKYEHNIKCFNPSVKADEVEPQVFAVLELLMTHPEIVEGRVMGFTEEEGMENNEELKTKKTDIETKLQQNCEEEQKLNKSYRTGLLSEEAYTNEAIGLRKNEKDFKKELNEVHMQLIKKEHDQAYKRKLKRLLSDFDRTKQEIDSMTKKEMLQMVFKEILIKDKKIATIDFYQPFGRYWEELKCNINQVMASSSENSSLLKPTAGR